MLVTLDKLPDPIAGINLPAKNASIGQQHTYIIMHIKPFMNLFMYGVTGGINCKI